MEPMVIPEIDSYIARTLPARDPVLAEMEELARENDFPIVGPQVGRFLVFLVRTMQVKRVFELGSGFGYSAYWLARAMGEGGHVTCTEGSEENARRARDAFRRAGMEDRLTFEVGDACDFLEKTAGPFDLILCDIDKWEYPRAFEIAVAKLRVGGALVADNLLWEGKVLGDDPDRDTRGILEYTKKIFEDPRVYSTVVPIRDGLGLSVRVE